MLYNNVYISYLSRDESIYLSLKGEPLNQHSRLNRANNMGFLIWDAKKLYELNQMCKTFNKMGPAGKKILEKEKFKKEMSMRDIISDIKKDIHDDY